jgi:hypothetical protein
MMPADESEVDSEIRRVCATLESIAAGYPSDSEEALAIRDAALAYIVVKQRSGLKNAYDKLRAAFGGVLTKEMKADLRRHGIEADELDDEDPV